MVDDSTRSAKTTAFQPTVQPNQCDSQTSLDGMIFVPHSVTSEATSRSAGGRDVQQSPGVQGRDDHSPFRRRQMHPLAKLRAGAAKRFSGQRAWTLDPARQQHARGHRRRSPQLPFRGNHLRTLCRCGASNNKPYCDGSHTKAGFAATGEPATEKSEPLEVRGGRLEVTPFPNGPLGIAGNVEICAGTGRTLNRTTKTALCRCGHSQNKPYCDGSHKAAGFTTD